MLFAWLARHRSPRAVIVVNRWDDIRQYLAALEEGAFDFIAPPFLASDVSWVLRSAHLYLAEKDKSHVKAAATAA